MKLTYFINRNNNKQTNKQIRLNLTIMYCNNVNDFIIR